MTREQAIRHAQLVANRTGQPVQVSAGFGRFETVHPSRPVLYLTGVTNPTVRERLGAQVGLLVTPDTHTERWIPAHPAGFGVDNGMYGLAKRHQEHKFDAERFYAWLDRLPRTALFVAVPDVLHFVALEEGGDEVPVGDAAATLAQYPVHAARIRAMGFRPALVGQDGIEELLGEIPWELVGAVFLGGSDAWKLGAGARALVAEAKRRGLHVHMGRANSLRRLQLAQDLGCDTADGTFLRFGSSTNVWRVAAWVGDLRMTAGAFGDLAGALGSDCTGRKVPRLHRPAPACCERCAALLTPRAASPQLELAGVRCGGV